MTAYGERWFIANAMAEDQLRKVPDGVIDALVTDPPAGISFMGKEWDGDRGGRDAWISWLAEVMREALRALKPGAHALVWALPRTSHWTATALEDAGFEIRDVGIHLFGTGFPKSLDVSKALDKAAGAKRKRIGVRASYRPAANAVRAPDGFQDRSDGSITAPTTDAARQWQGWGTALKPAAEHWILARKPLEGTVAQNVRKYGTGGINVDGCRIGTTKDVPASGRKLERTDGWGMGGDETAGTGFDQNVGRWPAHVTLDEDAAVILDEQSGTLTSGARTRARDDGADGWGTIGRGGPSAASTGGASRFFYVAKGSRSEKTCGGEVENKHPTVKSVALMRWLIRLITPPGGVVLDCFAGSGTTGVAALREGMEFFGIEQDPDHAKTAGLRCAHAEEELRG